MVSNTASSSWGETMQAPPQGRVLVRKTMQAIRDTMSTARNHVSALLRSRRAPQSGLRTALSWVRETRASARNPVDETFRRRRHGLSVRFADFVERLQGLATRLQGIEEPGGRPHTTGPCPACCAVFRAGSEQPRVSQRRRTRRDGQSMSCGTSRGCPARLSGESSPNEADTLTTTPIPHALPLASSPTNNARP